MKGYHYTSWENWQQIKREGLKPYDLENTAARNNVPENQVEKGTKAIWTWAERLQGHSEFGQIIWTIARRDTEKVVRLSYDYDRSDIYNSETRTHDLSFSTDYNRVSYHEGAPAHLVTCTIPPDRITCERVFEIASTEP